MNDEQLPRSIAQSTLEIAPGLTLVVHVLDNGQRVIEEQSIRDVLAWLAGSDGEIPDEIAILLAKEIKHDFIKE